MYFAPGLGCDQNQHHDANREPQPKACERGALSDEPSRPGERRLMAISSRLTRLRLGLALFNAATADEIRY